MTQFISKDIPVTADMLTSITDYLSGDFEHNLNACLLFKLIENDTNSMDKAFQVIEQHSDKFVPSALLNIAEKHMDQIPPARLQRQSNDIFTTYAEKMISIALKCKEAENKSADADTDSYRNMRSSYSIFDKKPDPDIQWVFKTFLKGNAKTWIKGRQFTHIINLVRETYAEDYQTLLSLLSTVEEEKIVFYHCKGVFSDKVSELIKKAVLKAAEALTPKYYRIFSTDLAQVKEKFVKYVLYGKEEFRGLLGDIKRVNRSKKKLIIELKKNYDF